MDHAWRVNVGEGAAERLVAALCDGVSLAAWRAAALAAVSDPRASLAAAALEQALHSADAVRLWDLYDDLETALFRLTTDEAAGVVRGWRERECIRVATTRAVGALVCSRDLPREYVIALAEPLLALSSREDGSGATTRAS